jgi:hypothetical protein
VRVGVDAHRDGGARQPAEGDAALLEHAAAALEAIDQPARKRDVHHGRLREHAREPVGEGGGTGVDGNGERDRRVVRRPVRADLVVDLVFGREPRDVGRVAGAEVHHDRAAGTGAGERDGERERDHHGSEGGIAPAPRGQSMIR